RGDGIRQEPWVLGERLAVPLRAELLEQRRRPFDVGEQQRDRAGRKLSHDPARMITRSERVRRARPPSRPRQAEEVTGPCSPGRQLLDDVAFAKGLTPIQ